MWFKNLHLYQLGPVLLDVEAINDNLASRPLTPCGCLERQRIGWLPVHGDRYAYHLPGRILIRLGIEDKVLPSVVIKQEAEERIQAITEDEGFRPGAKHRREIRHQVEDELLQQAFRKRSALHAWIDTKFGLIGIDTSSPAKAEQMIKLIVETIPDLPIKLLHTVKTPGSIMTDWLATDYAWPGFTVDRDGELRLPGEDRATVRYVHHAMDGEEIHEHIAAGKKVTRLGMTWHDRISFILTERFEIKRLQFLDIMKEQTETAKDAEALFASEFLLMTEDLGQLIVDLLAACGGVKTDLVDEAESNVN
jgi:recombination associated protein RdgC